MPKAQPDPGLGLLTTAQACARLGVSHKTLVKLWKEGKIERVRFGGQTRITARSLDGLVDLLEKDDPGGDSGQA